MGLIYRKRIKLFPGVRLNLSKSGISTSIGTRGVTVNLKGDRTRTSVGIPGSGLSYRTSSTIHPDDSELSRPFTVLRILLLILVVGALVYSMAS